MINKIVRARIMLFSLISQIQDGTFVKIKFFLAFVLHYFLKQLNITYTNFPSCSFKDEDLIYLTRKNTIDFWMASKFYEPDIRQFFLDAMKDDPNGVFIDVGSHIGKYSVLMAKKWQVYAFEPMKSTYNQLQKNIKINGVEKNITAFNYGLGDTSTSQNIYFSSHKHGEASLVQIENNSSTEMVNIKRFEELVPQKFDGRNVILKIDVEGFEDKVIYGMKGLIEEVKPMLILELWGDNLEKISNYLMDLGYFNFGQYWFPQDSIYKDYFKRIKENGEVYYDYRNN